jgi:transcriptional regulator with XRE-family HTH domain
MSITTAQIRGARGILHWSQSDLAERTGISATSIGSIENGQSKPRTSTLETIKKAFEDTGIEFIGQEGVRLKTGDVRILKGRSGYLDFFNEVYKVLGEEAGEVLVSNVDERKFAKWHGDHADEHLKRMSALTGIEYKILIQEGDTFFPAHGYAKYKWLPREQFSSVPFYVFGKKLAIMLFDNEPVVILLNYPAVAEAYRKQFQAMWDAAIVPPALDTTAKQAVRS